VGNPKVSARLRGTAGQFERRDVEAVEMGEIDSSDEWRWEGNEVMRNDQRSGVTWFDPHTGTQKSDSGCSLGTGWGMGNELLVSELNARTTLTMVRHIRVIE
jgi:hypothetical protein